MGRSAGHPGFGCSALLSLSSTYSRRKHDTMFFGHQRSICDSRSSKVQTPAMAAPAVPPCNDRLTNHLILHPLATGACHNLANNGANGAQIPCIDGLANGHHGAAFTVCGACADRSQFGPPLIGYRNTMARRSPPAAWNSPGGNAWAPAPVPHTAPPWDGFLTRMCSACERREQQLCWERLGGIVRAAAHLPAARRLLLGGRYPVDNCICDPTLSLRGPAERRCLLHKEDQYRRDMELARNTNDEWLRTLDVKVNRGEWVACTADVYARRRRINNGTFRACRCGSDVPALPAAARPEVMFCMSCEGTVHLVNPGAAPPAAVSQYLPMKKARLDARRDRPIALNRPRSWRTKKSAVSVNDA